MHKGVAVFSESDGTDSRLTADGGKEGVSAANSVENFRRSRPVGTEFYREFPALRTACSMIM